MRPTPVGKDLLLTDLHSIFGSLLIGESTLNGKTFLFFFFWGGGGGGGEERKFLTHYILVYSSSGMGGGEREKILNPLYTGILFQCYMLNKSICHFRGVGSTLSLLFYFDGKSC